MKAFDGDVNLLNGSASSAGGSQYSAAEKTKAWVEIRIETTNVVPERRRMSETIYVTLSPSSANVP